MRNADTLVHMLNLAALKHLVEVALNKVCGLLAWEKIDRSTIILDFDVLIITDKKALHCQFEDVLYAADRASHLACRDVEILLI